MTTKAKGITLPVWSYVRFTNGYLEVSTTTDFTADTTVKLTGIGLFPVIPTSLSTTSAPADINISGQNASGSFAASGGNVSVTPGIGSLGQASGNLSVKDSSGNGGAYNTSHLVTGTWHYWIDTAGKLRVKNGVPSSATDGTPVFYDYTGASTYDPPNLASGARATTTIAVAGVSLGDYVSSSFSLDLQGILLYAYVSASNTVTCVFHNLTAGALDLASGTLRVRVSKAP